MGGKLESEEAMGAQIMCGKGEMQRIMGFYEMKHRDKPYDKDDDSWTKNRLPLMMRARPNGGYPNGDRPV